MWNAAQWRKYKKPARFKKTSISYPHVLLLYYFHFVLSMFCTFVFTASCKAGHCCGTQDLFGGREWWWHNRCCQSPCKQYYVFFPVRRAVLLRCPDLLLLFLFICTKTSSCTHLPLLFVQYVWSSSKKPSITTAAISSSSSFVTHDMFQQQPTFYFFLHTSGGIFDPSLTLASLVDTSDTFLFRPVRRECQSKHSSTWRSERRRELIISLHLISFHRVLFRTHQILQKWVIQLSCQISNSPVFKSHLQTKQKLYNLYFQKTLKRKAKC